MPSSSPPRLRALRRDKSLMTLVQQIRGLSAAIAAATDPTQPMTTEYRLRKAEGDALVEQAQGLVTRRGGSPAQTMQLLDLLVKEGLE